MPYHLIGDGHSIDEATVRAAFSELVRTLDAATTDPDGRLHGRVWGGVWVGDDEEEREGFVLTSDEVRAE
jgi:hypothetical protein